MTQSDAWANPNVLIIRGSVSQVRYEKDRAYYTVLVSEVLKPRGGVTLSEISVVDANYLSTAQIVLKPGENIVLFVQQEPDHAYTSRREFHLDVPPDALKFRGLSLFLQLMYVSDKVIQRRQCLAAWNAKLSDPEKMSILDAMWETRFSGYGRRLMDISKGRDIPKIRSWAITILAYLDVSERLEELVPMLDEPDYELRRQLLLLFGMHRVKAAAPRIEKLLKSDIVTEAAYQADELKRMATQTLDKITGKSTSPYWK